MFSQKLCRGSCLEMFCKIGVLRNFAKVTEKHLCQSLFFNKVASLRPTTLLKKRLWHRWFLWIFRNFQEHIFLQNTSGGCFWLWTLREKCPNTGKYGPEITLYLYNFHAVGDIKKYLTKIN